ncbi:MAG: 30S ribosomal protein S12 methylthiotransferase RimO, partial [Acidobacteria bacterium]|nr:30S ribosomal protein S12 methylthiotransferase RimO [Acidobacteriota bacterium]
LKKTGRCRKLVVTGCLAERYRDTLRAEIPEIDVVLGTGEVPAIVGAVSQNSEMSGRKIFRLKEPVENAWTKRVFHKVQPEATSPAEATKTPAEATEALPTYIYDADTPRVLTTPRHYAYVKIAEGCDYTCAFCIIPTLRGPYRSRPADGIVCEVEQLAERGVREVILVSQDATFYGIDRGERGALARLLRRLNRIDGICWIRLLYLYPTTITDDLLEAMAECQKVCRYIDLPLQHASDPVLRRMRRPGSRAVYDKLLARVRSRVPDATLRTTFIVGFPGETPDDFEALCDFVRDTEFDHVGVFTYSHEEGTTASGYRDDVPERVKRTRRRSLMAVQQRIVRARHKRLVGSHVRVLIDGFAPDSAPVVRGRLAGQAPEIDPAVYLTDCDGDLFRTGDLIEATIVASKGYDLVARPV